MSGPDDSTGSSAGAERRASGAAPRWRAYRKCVWCGLAVLVIALSFLGLDRLFYENVSQRLNTEDRPFDHDFYSLTKPFWLFWRYTFGHVLGGIAIYFLIIATPNNRRRTANAALVAVASAALAANLAQVAIGRLRPNQAKSPVTFTSVHGWLSRQRVSFPSGEAATAFALAVVLAGLYPRWKGAFYAAGTLAAAARLVNGAHYLSDVVAGALFGAWWAGAVYAWVYRNYDRLSGVVHRPFEPRL